MFAVAALSAAAFAFVEMRMLWRFLQHRAEIREMASSHVRVAAGGRDVEPPTATIQIPLYNERTTAEQIILAAAAQDYPRDRFDIQVLDDSTDDTKEIVAEVVDRVRATGVRIEHIHRTDRSGYKAGALAAGLERSDAEFVAIFDADFVPGENFLRGLLVDEGYFDDPKVAFVQARWAWGGEVRGFLASALALLLDRHFFVQKPTRAYLGNVMTFNGSGGVWRRAAVEEAGGWSADTLTEDLDLSYRCALRGWHGVYTKDVAVPNQLPAHMRAFKMQQHRWAKGNAQCFRSLTGRVMASKDVLRDRWDEAFLLAGYAIHPILLATLLLWPWAVLYMDRLLFLVLQFLPAVAVIVAPLSFVVTVQERDGSWSFRSLRDVIAGLCVGIGLMINNTAGQLAGFLTRGGEFVRTPKDSSEEEEKEGAKPVRRRSYQVPLHWTFFAELLLIGYCVFGATLLISKGEGLWAMPLLFWGACVGLVAQLQLVPRAA
ncbi:MAG: glycosyltransferase [Gemmatimonadota bacterium]